METESLIREFIVTFNPSETSAVSDSDMPSSSDVISLAHMQEIAEGQKKCEREERLLLFEG